MKHLTLLTLLAFAAPFGWGEEVFVGKPIAWVVMSGDKVHRTVLTGSKQSEFQSVVVKMDGRYFWQSREMKELERHERGRFVTFLATDGTGYIKIDSSVALDSSTSQRTAYIEHLLLGLNTSTYQGWVVK
tara:strand:+ start:604 stop:993 length:390 start_codon:yes stop_codon:yes gene_type:complete